MMIVIHCQVASERRVLAIMRLRGEAERRLGAAFDMRDFHAVVIGSGAVSLPVLEQEVKAWIATVKPPD